jgi:hypothetical protein
MAETQQVVRAKLADGTVVQIESRATGPVESDVAAAGPMDFDNVVGSVKSISAALLDGLKTISPDKATLEFGVDVGVESGALTALLVKGTGSATLKITLEWAKG